MPTRQARADGPGSSAASAPAGDQSATEFAAGSAQLLNPEELFNILQSPNDEKPLILNVGPHLLYMQAHIPGAEYIGAGSDTQGIESVRRRVKPAAAQDFHRALLRLLPLESLSQCASCL